MTTQNLIETQTGLPHDSHSSLTAHEHVGFELGWDYAHYRVTPPAPYVQEPSPLRTGLIAGQATFGQRTLAGTRHVRKWLQLRLNAWLRGRSVELVQVTPNHLKQIDVSHCPITRAELSSATLEASDASVDRVRNDAGYAAGNLAVMSTKANHAKAAYGFRDALRFVQQIEAEQLPGLNGLTALQWSRVAVLCSFVEPLPHAEACALPLLVLPPNRLRLFNPVQALQAFVSQQLLKPGWSQRVSRFEDLLPGKSHEQAPGRPQACSTPSGGGTPQGVPGGNIKRDFKAFFMALLPRVLEAGKLTETLTTRWAIEDAWRSPLVQQRWAQFARQLEPAQCESQLVRATARRLGTTQLSAIGDAHATDGWALETRGYVPHSLLVAAPSAAEPQAQRQFAW